MLGDIDITHENYIEVDTDTGRCVRYVTPTVRTDEGDLETEVVTIPGIRVVFPETTP